MLKIADPVITALAEGRLKKDMPIECKAEKETRAHFTHLEAIGRTLCGIGSWLDCPNLTGEEEELRQKYAELCRQAIDKATDPESPDVMTFDYGIQPICDAAFFAHGMLRAKHELIEKLDPRVKKNLADRMKEIRGRKPGFNNFLLFSAMVEALLCELGEWWDPMRVDYALRQHEAWYAGDGVYNDGQEYCWNYYNSYVSAHVCRPVRILRPQGSRLVRLLNEGEQTRDALCRHSGAPYQPRRQLPAGRPFSGVQIRRVPASQPDGS